MAPPIPADTGFFDFGVKRELRFSLGFLKPSRGEMFGSPAAFAAPGAGGCFGFADPATGIAYGYVHNRMGGTLQDSRDMALRSALASALDALRATPEPAGLQLSPQAQRRQ